MLGLTPRVVRLRPCWFEFPISSLANHALTLTRNGSILTLQLAVLPEVSAERHSEQSLHPSESSDRQSSGSQT